LEAKLLWIEGSRADSPDFVPTLRKKGFTIEVVPSAKAAEERALVLNPDVVVVNAASLATSGKRICHNLSERLNGKPIILINYKEYITSGNIDANVVLVLPFTARKLINRIRSLMPFNTKRGLKVGAITLDKERNLVRCEGREHRLTPCLVKLLQILMQHPGEVIEREHLFTTIWETDYIGDTRTLDVHISWLRKAIEADPRAPKYLKTIRGIGYRLDA
jgi:DNA-binding response OmpR family regulator